MTEFRPNRFEILPVIIKNLIIINGLFFLAQNVNEQQHWLDIDQWLALHTWQSSMFKPWQFVTHLFLHGNFSHLLSNMFALWMFGSILENLWGGQRFLLFYISCGIGAALCHMGVLYIENAAIVKDFYALNPLTADGNPTTAYFIQKYLSVPQNVPITYDIARQVLNARLDEATIGASGAVFGCLAAFGFLFPNTKLYIYFFFPVKAKWFVLGYAAVELVLATNNSAGDNVAHVAHLGGALVGLILVYFWNKKNRRHFY